MSGDPFDNLDALLGEQLGNADVAAAVDPRERRKRDKRMSQAKTGRPSKGRHSQFNCKMREDLHRLIGKASRASGKSIVDMAEEAFTDYLAKIAGARHAS
jgi:hypothetical protein